MTNLRERATATCPKCKREFEGRFSAEGRLIMCLACHAACMRAFRQRTPLTAEQRLKDNVRSYANVYLRRGMLRRLPCAECGDDRAQMHHHDYAKPLEVEWLCRPCHLARHGRLPVLQMTAVQILHWIEKMAA